MSESDGKTSRRILVGDAEKAGRAAAPLVGGSLWPPLAWAGLALLLVGLADLVLAWVPTGLGNREWEFGTVTATLNGLPVVLMGTVLAYLGAANHGMVRATKVIGVASLLGALVIVAMVGLYLTNVPLALQAVDGPLLLGVKKSIAKSLVQGVVYPLTFGYVGVRGLRHFRPAGGG